ncbi:hypothetical protein ABDB91_16635 [Desulfoscipio sp. XC116]|uniref:LolA family protein n=1 Tax=Desulfoscipio sp. XC116 TaxID=3144975 RepID=UPI00325AD35C
MLNKFKIFLTIVLFIIFGSFGLAGCGGDKQESSGGSQTADTGQEAAQSTDRESARDLLAKGQKNEGMTCDYVLTVEDIIVRGKMWAHGDNVKNETTAEGQKIIMLSDGNTFYSYNPAENTAIKYTDEDMQGDSDEIDTPLDYTEDVDGEDVITELETVNHEGVKCRVLLAREKDSQDEAKMWVREDCGLPVRVEETDANGTKSVMEYKNLEVGALPADIFELPADVTVRDISEMISRM